MHDFDNPRIMHAPAPDMIRSAAMQGLHRFLYTGRWPV